MAKDAQGAHFKAGGKAPTPQPAHVKVPDNPYLAAAQEAGAKRAFVGVEIERESYEDIAQNEIVRKRGIPVGICRQMIYGYTVDKNIGFAIVDAKKCPLGTRVTIGPNDSPATLVEAKWC